MIQLTVFIFFLISIMVYHRILNIVPYAIQQELVVYPSYTYQFESANPKLPIYPSLTLSWQPQVCSVCLRVCFCLQIRLFVDSTHKWYSYGICLCLAYFIQDDNLQVHPCYCIWQIFWIFLWLSSISLYKCATFSFIHLSVGIQIVFLFWLLWTVL